MNDGIISEARSRQKFRFVKYRKAKRPGSHDNNINNNNNNNPSLLEGLCSITVKTRLFTA
jgi:hypothetical protein